MSRLISFVVKEFFHLFRDRKTLLIMFGLPIVQVLLFGFALTNEVKDIKIAIANPVESHQYDEIISKIENCGHFNVVHRENDVSKISDYFMKREIRSAIILSKDQIQIITDGSDPNFSKTVVNYITAIFHNSNKEISSSFSPKIDVRTTLLYNPELDGTVSFVPGIIAMVMMIICSTLASITVVREKESGTMEVLLASPVSPLLILISKSIPYFILSLINLIAIIVVSVFVMGVPFRGNLLLMLIVSIIFIVCCLSFGLLISGGTNSQSAAMIISNMGTLLPTMLFTGFLFPLENMPLIFQWFSYIVPAKWFYDIATSIMLKGAGFLAIWKEFVILSSMATLLLFTSLISFKRRLE